MDRYDKIRAMYTTYIERTARYARKEYLRTLAYKAHEEDFDSMPEDKLVAPNDRYFSDDFDFTEDRLAAAFTELPLLWRQVLTMIFIADLTAQEIAERLGCSVAYVHKQKHLALKKLRDLLAGRGEPDDQ